MIKYADAFCGMGGFSQAMKNLYGDKAKCVWAIDIEEKAAASFEKNFGYKGACGDIWDVCESLPKSIPDVDVLFGGFPCQPFSINGTGFRNKAGAIAGTVNESDDRRHLYKALVAILNAKQPRRFVFENVGGLTRIEDANGDKMIGVVCQAFADCGYLVESKILNAADFGVPQQRKRVYIVGVRGGEGEVFDFGKVTPATKKFAITDILEENVAGKYLLKNFWETYTCKPVETTKFDIGPKGWGHLYMPQWDTSTKEQRAEYGGPPVNRYVVMKYLYDNATEKPNAPTGKISLVSVIYGDTPSGISRQGDRVYSRFGICPTLATFSVSIPKIDSEQGLRVLTPRECARLQGFPESYQLPGKDGVAYKQIGNAVCVKVVEAVLSPLLME